MEKNDKHTDKKKITIIGGLSALCITVLAGVCLLTRNPEGDLAPVSTECTDVTDTCILSEDAADTASSCSDSSTRDSVVQETPEMPPESIPESTDDLSDPDGQPEYEPPVLEPTRKPTPSPQPDQSEPADGGSTEDSHPGQVYDPVFGWIDVEDTQQDNIDSDGDIDKQIGTMGGN